MLSDIRKKKKSIMKCSLNMYIIIIIEKAQGIYFEGMCHHEIRRSKVNEFQMCV